MNIFIFTSSISFCLKNLRKVRHLNHLIGWDLGGLFFEFIFFIHYDSVSVSALIIFHFFYVAFLLNAICFFSFYDDFCFAVFIDVFSSFDHGLGFSIFSLFIQITSYISSASFLNSDWIYCYLACIFWHSIIPVFFDVSLNSSFFTIASIQAQIK